jgi:hypothetical protein
MNTTRQARLAVTTVTLPRDHGYGERMHISPYLERRWRCNMQKDERDLLEVLRFELQFLKDGGYGRSPKSPWRPQYIFEDSLTCMNYDSKDNPRPCSECVLKQLVPPESRSERIPCRHIPFNLTGETLASLYRCSDQNEIEETVEPWLRTTIQRLEQARMAAHDTQSNPPAPSGATLTATPLYQKLHPKCANPACPTAFHWAGGGTFYRFRPDPVIAGESTASTDSPCGIHGVRHYWLCERCSHALTLVYEEKHGVVVRLLWPELPVKRPPEELSAAKCV